MSENPSVAELVIAVNAIAAALREKYGPRSGALIAVSVPVGDHDRFACSLTGPCMTARGLLDYANEESRAQIRAGEAAFPKISAGKVLEMVTRFTANTTGGSASSGVGATAGGVTPIPGSSDR